MNDSKRRSISIFFAQWSFRDFQMSEFDDDLRAHETDLTGTWIIQTGV
jgi:hypothetical protein